MKIVERYKAIDPNYGSQEHQRDFIARLEYMQRVAPCPKPEDDSHEHGPECYSQAIKDQAIREVRNHRSSQPVKP